MAQKLDQRINERMPVMIVAELRWGMARSAFARVRDISSGGMRIACLRRLQPGRWIEIRLPHGDWISARVVWRHARLIGLRFRKPIDPACALGLQADRAPLAIA